MVVHIAVPGSAIAVLRHYHGSAIGRRGKMDTGTTGLGGLGQDAYWPRRGWGGEDLTHAGTTGVGESGGTIHYLCRGMGGDRVRGAIFATALTQTAKTNWPQPYVIACFVDFILFTVSSSLSPFPEPA